MKHLKTYENLRDSNKSINYKKYINKWVVLKSLDNNKIAIAKFEKIQNDNYVWLFIPGDSPFRVGGHCGVHISNFNVLDSCDNKEDTIEMLNRVKMKEDAKKYNL